MHPEGGQVLIPIARGAIAAEFGDGAEVLANAVWLQKLAASFVTLRCRGELRGCVGSLAAQRSLLEDVRANAVAAAFSDSRFAPLSAGEFHATRIEISVLSPLEPVNFTGEADLLARLRPGVDGVALSYGARRATFLPQMWEQLSDARQFLAQLKMKAGLPADFWCEDIFVSRYGVSKFVETESRND
jgi:AmmeMemoRadiSam system protein A